MAEAYCVKCRAKKEIKNPQEVVWKNGRRAMTGTDEFGHKVARVLGKA